MCGYFERDDDDDNENDVDVEDVDGKLRRSGVHYRLQCYGKVWNLWDILETHEILWNSYGSDEPR